MSDRIRDFITQFVNEYSTKKRLEIEWSEPLVGYASTIDPLFLKLKKVVSTSHSLPQSLLKDARTVIAYFIPFHKAIVKSNVQGRRCSREWAIAYIETNKLIIDLNKSLSETLEQAGFKFVLLPPTHNFDEKTLMSTWSHKHIAFIAGLGKFGLHHMLITERGCCGRLGSLITTAQIPPSDKPEHAFCLYYYDGSCQRCVENCVFGALNIDWFDRYQCYCICQSNAKSYFELGFADVCGKCVCVVPCSFSNPVI